jgi:hypothetical protein
LLNVFLAIAVDNLGDADEADEEEKEKEAAEQAAANGDVQVSYLEHLYSCITMIYHRSLFV